MPQWETAVQTMRTVIKGTYENGHPIINVFDWDTLNAASEENDDQWAQHILDHWQEEVLTVIVNNYELEGASWAQLGGLPWASGFVGPDVTKPMQGAVLSDATPPNVAALVHKNTSVRRGRSYIGPIAENSINESGVIAPATRATITGAMTSFVNECAGDGFRLVVLHNPPSGVEAVKTFVSGVSCDTVVATQRRRLR